MPIDLAAKVIADLSRNGGALLDEHGGAIFLDGNRLFGAEFIPVVRRYGVLGAAGGELFELGPQIKGRHPCDLVTELDGVCEIFSVILREQPVSEALFESLPVLLDCEKYAPRVPSRELLQSGERGELEVMPLVFNDEASGATSVALRPLVIAIRLSPLCTCCKSEPTEGPDECADGGDESGEDICHAGSLGHRLLVCQSWTPLLQPIPREALTVSSRDPSPA